MAISIHAPRTGSDFLTPVLTTSHDDFNPRSPHGERLPTCVAVSSATPFQSTLPARGATWFYPAAQEFYDISIHAPRTGSDCQGAVQKEPRTISIHAPRTGSDFRFFDFFPNHGISIHAPRTGSDFPSPTHFQPPATFQSTLPARGATAQRIHRMLTATHFNPRSPHGERP